MADLFGVGVPAISKHLDNICESGEWQREAAVSILETVKQGGERQVKHQMEFYNRFLAFNEFRILEGYGTISRQQAEEKVFLRI